MQDAWRGDARRCCRGRRRSRCCVSAQAVGSASLGAPQAGASRTRRTPVLRLPSHNPSIFVARPRSAHAARRSRQRHHRACRQAREVPRSPGRSAWHAQQRRGAPDRHPSTSPASARRCPSRNSGRAGVTFNSAPPARKSAALHPAPRKTTRRQAPSSERLFPTRRAWTAPSPSRCSGPVRRVAARPATHHVH